MSLTHIKQEFKEVGLECFENLTRDFFVKYLEGVNLVLLKGSMGSGKTTLTRFFLNTFGLHFLGSPTFAYIHEYSLQGSFQSFNTIYHSDLDRVLSSEEFALLDFDEILNNPQYLLIVENYKNYFNSFLQQGKKYCVINIQECPHNEDLRNIEVLVQQKAQCPPVL